jgi:hypothetical protein
MKNQRGISAILLVVLIGAVALIFINTTAIMSIDEVESAFISERGSAVNSMSFSCVEEILRRIQIDNDLEVNDYVLNFEEGNCVINSSIFGDEISINVLANLGDYYNELNVMGEIADGVISISSWEN